MTYQLTIKPKAVKALEEINEPHYSNVKEVIYNLADNPRPTWIYKTKRSGWLPCTSWQLSYPI